MNTYDKIILLKHVLNLNHKILYKKFNTIFSKDDITSHNLWWYIHDKKKYTKQFLITLNKVWKEIYSTLTDNEIDTICYKNEGQDYDFKRSIKKLKEYLNTKKTIT